MDTTILAQLGLKVNERKVYETLVSLGKTKTGPIIALSGVGSSQVYSSLTRLVSRGLVSYQVRNNVRYYQAELPTTLIETTRKKIAALEKLSEEIEKIPEQSEPRNFVNAFEGKDGFKKAIVRHVELLEEGENIAVVGFSSQVGDLKELRSLLKVANELAESKKCTMRMILDKKFKNSLEERKGPAYSVRFLNSSYFTPTGINISKNEVVLSVWGDNPIAISINESSVIESFKKNFEYMWKRARQD